MLDAGGGGGGTPWESMTIDKMQSLIQNPDTDKQWDLVTGWKKSAELISQHRFQVESYRDSLASAWPPERSAASAQYIDRLNALLANLNETHEAALANYNAVASATGSIYQAQVQMEKIYQEYKNNETALNAFTAQQQQQQSSGQPTPSPSPSGEEPPVAPGRQEALRLQAVNLLSGVSTELAQAQVRIVRPTLYERIEKTGKETDPGGGDTFPPPVIPPITPNFADSETSTKSTHTTPTTFPTSPNATVPSPVTTPSVGVGTQPGLVLGGANQPLPAPPTTGLSPINPALPSGGGQFTNPGLISPTTGLLPGGGQSLTPNTSGTGRGVPSAREGLIRPGSASLPEGGLRAGTPGGVIGGMPGGGAGQPASGRAGMRRVNPVGGIIGGSESVTRPGAAGSAAGSRVGGSTTEGPRRAGGGGVSSAGHPGGPYGQGGGRRSGRPEEAEESRWDPDNPWETAEGVDPVVMPSREQRVDPGPAIGLG
jgi:hypothetical protein